MKKLTLNPYLLNSITYPYVYRDNFFTEDELQAIEQYCASKGTDSAEVVSRSGVAINADNMRRSDVKMHGVDQENKWIFDKLIDCAETINNQYYGYDLLGFDYFQYTEYNGPGSEYGYHMDMIMGERVPPGMEIPRKLSFSLILSHPNDYVGGEFEFIVNGVDTITVPQPRGRLLAFPSYIIHRVSPLTDGHRKSLVFWAIGPKFK